MIAIRTWLVILCWSLPLLGADNGLLERIHQVLLQSPGTAMDIQIRQEQYENIFTTTAYVEILGSERYYFDSADQTILVDNKTIKTWNKASQQLIIDTLLEDEFSLFRLLAGHFQGLEITNVDSSKEIITLTFNIPDMSVTGQLMVWSNSLQPKQIQFTYDEDNLFTAMIANFRLLGPTAQSQQFNPQPKEIIDLRE